MTTVSGILLKSAGLVSPDFYSGCGKLFLPEHLEKLASRLLLFFIQGPWQKQPPPYFEEERTPPLHRAYDYFHPALILWKEKRLSEEELAGAFALAMEGAGIANILLLMGQRITPASLTGCEAIPPLRLQLLEAASVVFRSGMTKAGREWTKHTQRSGDRFWGQIEGDEAYKNRRGMEFIEKILEEQTWWNVFGHFKHRIVFEARLPSGHGARWGQDGKEFIGFLEPFLNSKDKQGEDE